MSNRKNEILQVAFNLFENKGYDETSTNDIVNKIGISRGTLYHHFKSKEEILDTLIANLSRDIFDRAWKIAKNKEVPVFDRLNQVVQAMNVSNQNDVLMSQVHQPQNALMHEKIKNQILTEVPKIFNYIVEEGIEQGMMSTPYPFESCEMLVAYINAYFDDHSPEVHMQDFIKKIKALSYNLELIFGTQPGAFDVIFKGMGKIQ